MIFEAISDWINEHGEKSDCYPRIVSLLRMPLIELKDLLHTIRPSKFFSADAILDAIQEQSEKNSSELVYRGFLWPNTNVATTSHASIVAGESEAAIQDGYSHTNQQDDKMTRHLINDTDPGIVIQFNRPFILNNIRLMLFDRDQRVFCSYYIEQNLFFSQRVVKYIRIVGTYCSNSQFFSLAHVEAQYTTEPFTVDPATTLLIPTSNVATIQNNALVVEGVSRLRNCLINGETNTYDWDNGYTCHQVGSGAIAVQLPQAYLIDSLRLLLWDCDERYYQYYVEVSVDQKTWVRVADKTQEQCRAWQLIRFERRPVVFVRIVGTHNSANEVFHCVHFECPAQRSSPRPSTAEFKV
uniref:F5/8 type C domain-containing protein n=1 Tax=Steinernema glaseri TaxID=37863 RepID=A0A1I7ZJ69_9BILA